MKNKNIIPFQFEDFDVRIVDQSGEPWFVATDVANALEYKNPWKVVTDHCKRAVTFNLNTLTKREGIRGNPNVTIIPESDVYRLIIKSRLPKAQKFEEWIMEEVIPSVRKTGKYDATEKKRGRPTTTPQDKLPWFKRLDVSPEEEKAIKQINTEWRHTMKEAGIPRVQFAQAKLYDHAFEEKGLRKHKRKAWQKPMNLEQIRFVAEIEKDSAVLVRHTLPLIENEDDVMETIYDVTDSKKAFLRGDSTAYLEKAFAIADRMDQVKQIEQKKPLRGQDLIPDDVKASMGKGA